MNHLQEKYKETEEEKLQAPPGTENFNHLSAFSREKYANIEKDKVEVPIIGKIELSEEEKAILRKNPKFALPERLEENTMHESKEKAVTA